MALRRFARGGGGLARKGNASLHPKHGPRSFYKGYGAPSMGRHTRKARYIVDYRNKVPQYIMPGTPRFGENSRDAVLPPQISVVSPGWDQGLKPYVAADTPKVVVPPPPMPCMSLVKASKSRKSN